MSGGSFNYAYVKCIGEDGETLGLLEELESLAFGLETRGFADAAGETRAVEKAIRAWIEDGRRLEESLDELRKVWHALEWVVSCDSSEERLAEAVQKWRQSRCPCCGHPNKEKPDA